MYHLLVLFLAIPSGDDVMMTMWNMSVCCSCVVRVYVYFIFQKPLLFLFFITNKSGLCIWRTLHVHDGGIPFLKEFIFVGRNKTI